MGLIPGLGRCPGGGNGNLVQKPCLGNPMDRGAWWAAIHGDTKESDTTKRLNKNITQEYRLPHPRGEYRVVTK